MVGAVNSRVFPAWTPWVRPTAPRGLVSTYALYASSPPLALSSHHDRPSTTSLLPITRSHRYGDEFDLENTFVGAMARPAARVKGWAEKNSTGRYHFNVSCLDRRVGYFGIPGYTAKLILWADRRVERIIAQLLRGQDSKPVDKSDL